MSIVVVEPRVSALGVTLMQVDKRFRPVRDQGSSHAQNGTAFPDRAPTNAPEKLIEGEASAEGGIDRVGAAGAKRGFARSACGAGLGSRKVRLERMT